MMNISTVQRHFFVAFFVLSYVSTGYNYYLTLIYNML